jgi:hypothetical protein
MVEHQEIQAAVTEYVRSYIEALRRRDLSYSKIGQRIGMSKAQVQYIHRPDKYGPRLVGSAMETEVANRLHRGSIDELRASAFALVKGASLLVQDGVEEVVVSPLAEEDRKQPSSVPPAARSRG